MDFNIRLETESNGRSVRYTICVEDILNLTGGCLFYLQIEFRPKLAFITSFQNNLYTMGDALLRPPFNKLKGAGHSLLCMALDMAMAHGLTSIDDNIALIAYGTLGSKSMEGLIRYYEHLGFSPVAPVVIYDSETFMKAPIRRIMERCSNATASPELKKAIEHFLSEKRETLIR